MSVSAGPSPIQVELGQALGLVRLDRWQLGGLRDGRMRIIADSAPDAGRPFGGVRRLTNLARRCLHERRPVTLTAVGGLDARPEAEAGDWETEWSALLYAPVGLPGRRPVGVLVAGCRGEYWWGPEEVDYFAALAMTLTPAVLSVDGPMARLSALERRAARLLAQGLSLPEMAIAMEVESMAARELIGVVLRKLSLRSPRQLTDLWAELAPFADARP